MQPAVEAVREPGGVSDSKTGQLFLPLDVEFLDRSTWMHSSVFRNAAHLNIKIANFRHRPVVRDAFEPLFIWVYFFTGPGEAGCSSKLTDCLNASRY